MLLTFQISGLAYLIHLNHLCFRINLPVNNEIKNSKHGSLMIRYNVEESQCNMDRSFF